jgi:arsenate reductase
MAEGILKALYGTHCEAYSVGTHPAGVLPWAIPVMKEIDIDISKHSSKSLGKFRETKFDYVIALCDNSREACPFFAHVLSYLHERFSDPA